MYTNGVILEDISRHVKSTLGVSMSRHAVHRLMNPLQQKTRASVRYKGLIDA